MALRLFHSRLSVFACAGNQRPVLIFESRSGEACFVHRAPDLVSAMNTYALAAGRPYVCWWFVLIGDLPEAFEDVEQMVRMLRADALGRGPSGGP